MIWHPFTSQADATAPLKIARAEREYVYDQTGCEYVDAVSSWWTVIHGHNHPQIVAAIQKQLSQLDHVMLAGFTHDAAEQAAAALLQAAGGNFSHVFYSDNGSTAVEVMLKLAVQYWYNLGQPSKSRFIRFGAAYHGDTLGAMSVAANSVFNQPFSSLLFGAPCFRYPQAGADSEIFRDLEDFLEKHSSEIAGIIIEPLIAAAGGMVLQTAATLRQLEAMARRHNVLLLYDEVFTGLGRTGAMFAFEKSGTRPDLVALAKGLTGGALPLAVTLVSPNVRAAFVSENPAHTFYHGHTMTGNPPGCAAAIASLSLFSQENRLRQVAELETQMARLWKSIADRHSGKVCNVRSLGAMSAADLVSSREAPGYGFSAAQAMRVQALAEGVILRPLGNVLYVTPPYNISDAALERVFACIDKLLVNYDP